MTSWYPTRENPVGGVFVREHAKAVQLFDDVVLVHLAGPRKGLRGWWELEKESDEVFTDGIPTYRLWHRRSPIPKTSVLVRQWAVVHMLRALRTQGFQPHIIHANVYDSAFASLMAARLYRIPMVVTEHFTGFPRGILTRLDVAAVRLAFASARVVMPVSHDLLRSITGYGIRANFQVIPNVADLRMFHPDDRAFEVRIYKCLLFVGLLDPSHKKGLPILFRALADLARRRDDWHLDMVGDGPARPEYERMVAEFGLRDKVTFHGLRPKADVAQFMRQADIFVLPSLWENLPCVLIEAMASGLPIVSTIVGGIPEIVDPELGLLVPPGDAGALAQALNQMLDSLDRYDRNAIAHKALRFSPEVVGAAIDRVYRETIGFPNAASRMIPAAAQRGEPR